jgi:hypothetical protein
MANPNSAKKVSTEALSYRGPTKDHYFFAKGVELLHELVPQPEGNGVAERFIRTLKENLLWVRTIADRTDAWERPLHMKKPVPSSSAARFAEPQLKIVDIELMQVNYVNQLISLILYLESDRGILQLDWRSAAPSAHLRRQGDPAAGHYNRPRAPPSRP